VGRNERRGRGRRPLLFMPIYRKKGTMPVRASVLQLQLHQRTRRHDHRLPIMGLSINVQSNSTSFVLWIVDHFGCVVCVTMWEAVPVLWTFEALGLQSQSEVEVDASGIQGREKDSEDAELGCDVAG